MVAGAPPQHGSWIPNESILRDKGKHCRPKAQPLKLHRIDIVTLLVIASNNRDNLGSGEGGPDG